MDIMLASAAFVVCATCAGLMGFSIQRGATCTVAAVDEIVSRRRCLRLLGLIEASLWVAGGLLIAQALRALPNMPGGYAVSAQTFLGGVLLGVGAFVNGACVFGTLARLGTGEWAYAISPLGFYLGCLTVGALFGQPSPPKLADESPVLNAASWTAVLFAALMLLRVGHGLLRTKREAAASPMRWHDAIARRIFSPHAATAIIGITFFFMLFVAGAWAYTDVLAEVAQGMTRNLFVRGALLVALFGGAVIGGVTAGRFRSTPPTARQLGRCLAGGALMGSGSLLIPGSNDGLILVGMPLLWPYAWVAFATMCVSIAVAMLAAGTVRRAPTGGAAAAVEQTS